MLVSLERTHMFNPRTGVPVSRNLIFSYKHFLTTGDDKEVQQTSSYGIPGTVDHTPKKGMLLPFQPMSLVFNHINYYVDMPAVSVLLFNFQFVLC